MHKYRAKVGELEAAAAEQVLFQDKKLPVVHAVFELTSSIVKTHKWTMDI